LASIPESKAVAQKAIDALQLYRLLVTDYPADATGEPWR
jgi:hypothetical protein